jgi:hypothetical protein
MGHWSVIPAPYGDKLQSQDASQDPEFGEFAQESTILEMKNGFPLV